MLFDLFWSHKHLGSPFPIKIIFTSATPIYLTSDELQLMADKDLATDRLRQVRDIFLFCCFTWLAYIDVKNLRKTDIVTGVDGEQWIAIKRQKTNTPSRIPLLPISALLKKYQSHRGCLNTGMLLPVMSNQKMNSYLKEIADFVVYRNC